MRKQRLEQEVRVEYDFGPEDIREVVNWVLAEYNLELVDDDLEHDGYSIWTLKEVE